MKNAKEFFWLATERESIRINRELGEPWPWTHDKTFRDWRFCNVRREDDKTTAWFREHVRNHVQGWQAVEAVVAFRWFNRIEVGERVKDLLIHGFDVKEARLRLHGMKPVTTGAYIIKTPDGLDKLDGVLACILMAQKMLKHGWGAWGASLKGAWRTLIEVPYLGNFMAYEIVSDLRWTNVLERAGDINTWASAGPGCARGLGWVVDGNPELFNYHSEKDQERMLEVMRDLLALSSCKSRDGDYWPFQVSWEMREVEHWACEAWKYIRCRDYGRPPRQRYKR